MTSNLTPAGLIGAALLAGLLSGLVFYRVPAGSQEAVRAMELAAPEWSQTQSFVDAAAELRRLQPFGEPAPARPGALAAGRDVIDPYAAHRAAQLAAAEAEAARWQFLGTVLQGSSRYGLFLDGDEQVHRLAIGQSLRGRLRLVDLGEDSAVLGLDDEGDGTASRISVRLFRQTLFSPEAGSDVPSEQQYPEGTF